MKPTLTDYFEARGHDPEAVQNLLVAIRRILRFELKRRGAPHRFEPRYVGLDGHEWTDFDIKWDGKPEENFDLGPLTELAIECYHYVIIVRGDLLDSKRGQNIDGYIRRNIRNFLIDAQRKNDPAGTAIFRSFRMVFEDWLLAGVVSADELPVTRFTNDTSLFFARMSEHPEVQAQVLYELVKSLPKAYPLARKVCLRFDKSARDLLEHTLLELSPSTPRFYFGDYINPWKKIARIALQHDMKDELPAFSVLHDSDGSATDMTESHDEDTGFREFEEHQQALEIIRKLRQQLSAHSFQKRVRVRLENILELFEKSVISLHSEEVSQAEIARRLNVSTSTFSEDIQRIRELYLSIDTDE